MALSLVSRCDATFPTSTSKSLLGAVVGVVADAPPGQADATNLPSNAAFGGNFGGTFF